MIKHVLFFKSSKEDYEDEIKTLKLMLESLKDKIVEIKYMEVLLNTLKADRNSHLYYEVRFDSMEDLNAYNINSDHQKVSEFVKNNKINLSIVDCEF